MPLTESQYKAVQGQKCPNCESSEIQAVDYEPNGTDVIANVSCDSCSAYWIDVYTLHGYDQLHVYITS